MSAHRAAAVFALLLLAAGADAATDQARDQDIYNALSAAGLGSAVVDVTPERVLVSYEHPPLDSDNGVELAWLYIMGAAARDAPDSKEIVIITSSHGEPIMKATVKTSYVKDFIDKKMDAKTLQGRIKVESVMAASRKCGDNMAYVDGKCECVQGLRESSGRCAIGSGSGGTWCLLGGFGLAAAAGLFAALLAAAGLLFWLRRRK